MTIVRVFVEAEAGSSTRHAFNETSFESLGSRRLAATHPYPYGFVIGTTTDDGDAVDCWLLTDRPVSAGRLVEAEPVGLLEQLEDGVPDHKLLAVPSGEPHEVDPAARARIDRFVRDVFGEYADVRVEVGRLLGADAAAAHVDSHRVDSASNEGPAPGADPSQGC